MAPIEEFKDWVSILRECAIFNYSFSCITQYMCESWRNQKWNVKGLWPGCEESPISTSRLVLKAIKTSIEGQKPKVLHLHQLHHIVSLVASKH